MYIFPSVILSRSDLISKLSVSRFKIRSHGATAAMVPLSIGFQPHSVWQWQSNIQCNAKYFATAAAAQNGVGTYLLVAALPQPLPQVLV